MKQLLNTLYVLSEDVYLALEGENVLAKKGDDIVSRYPLHGLADIISFSYAGASPALMHECTEKSIGLAFCSPSGKFLARVAGANNGNVLLRRQQYRLADNTCDRVRIARMFIFGKVFNSRWVIERCIRDHHDKIDSASMSSVSKELQAILGKIKYAPDNTEVLGYEGMAASLYFSVFDQLILTNKDVFKFTSRSQRPPLDRINALLSFAYSMLSLKCASALESVGLDSYVGFLHTDRPGRYSLALDLMEELRAPFADRFALTMINNKIIKESHFHISLNGAVMLNEEGKRLFLKYWQERFQDEIVHPFLNEKIKWGLVPYVQALLLARFIRGDIEDYPPFLWK